MKPIIALLIGATLSAGSASALVNITPFVTCVTHDTAGGTLTAYLGYESFEQAIVQIMVGNNNRFVPDPADRGQPTLFLPGYFEKAFRVTFPDATNLLWVFDGFEILVNASTAPCPATLPVPSLPQATVGVPYFQQLAASGGQAVLTWSATTGMPPGLNIGSGGQITGSPLAAGQFVIGLQVTDGLTTSTRTYQISVSPGLTVDDAISLRPPGFTPQFRVVTNVAATISATASCNLNEFVVTGGGVCTVPNSNTVQGRIASSAPSANGWGVTCSGGTATAVAVCNLK